MSAKNNGGLWVSGQRDPVSGRNGAGHWKPMTFDMLEIRCELLFGRG